MKGRLRIHIIQNRMTYAEADTLSWYLEEQENVTEVKVYERTADAVICYKGEREEILTVLKQFSYEKAEVPETVLSSSGRQLNEEYKERLITKTVLHYGSKLFLPMPVRAVITSVKSVKYIWKGIRCLAHGRLEVPVLDATAISVSVFRKDFATAGSVMFLLGIGEIIEEWTHKKSVGDLARSMSLNVKKVWLKREDQEILVKSSEVQPGDEIIVHMGNVIPFDGEVSDGEGMVNQASLTGEAMPVRRVSGQSVYAGTVLEEGELQIRVKAVTGSTRYEKIVSMIEDSEKLKSSVEGKAEHLADRLVPYTLLGTGAAWLLTRNVTRTLSVLMVDFSCALKLAMPITVLANTNTQNSTDLPQIVSWDDGHGYLESGEMLRNGWGYDTVNPAGKYVLFDEEGAILRRSESMEAGLEDNYTGTEQVPAVIAFRAQVFDGFAGTIEAILEEQNGVTQTVFLNADNFYEWNLSTGSGTYRIQSVSATEGDLSFVTEFSNMYQNLPEEGLLVQKITVTEVVIEKIPAAGEESQAAEKNENPIDEMNVLPQKGQEEETEGILENQAQEVNIVDAVKQKNPFILLGVGVALIAAIGGLIWSKKR